MLKYKCLVLDHDDTVVQSEATVNYPCFCRYLEIYRPNQTISLADYVGDCNKMAFVEMCKHRFALTDEELEVEYRFWKDYAKNHMPDPFPGIKQLLQRYRRAGGIICVSSMSAHDTILRDYRTHFGLEPDALFGWDIPEEYRKPHPYALVEVQKRYGLKPEEILVVDDMKFAVPMARSVGCPIAFAGWGRQQFPDIYREMESLCDHTFSTVTALEEFLFEV
jgi:phosphoglycolate phosphatase/pyrophosphatase PpaX